MTERIKKALCRYCIPHKSDHHIIPCKSCGGWRNPRRKQARTTSVEER